MNELQPGDVVQNKEGLRGIVILPTYEYDPLEIMWQDGSVSPLSDVPRPWLKEQLVIDLSDRDTVRTIWAEGNRSLALFEEFLGDLILSLKEPVVPHTLATRVRDRNGNVWALPAVDAERWVCLTVILVNRTIKELRGGLGPITVIS